VSAASRAPRAAIERVVIIGAGGHAREVLDIFEAANAAATRYEVLGWLVDSEHGRPGMLVHERPILGDLSWFRDHAGEALAICAIGAPELRRSVVERARRCGARFGRAVHPAAVLTPRVRLGDGVVIAAGSVLTNAIELGAHAHVNTGCTIAHDAVLGDFATLSPGVHLAGGVVIGEGSWLGTGANLIPRVRVGAWSIVGAGCTVIADVPPDSTVVGVPGRVIAQRAAGWHARPAAGERS
jgi:sugar O-acyltransferase (sialic acid O-acetyltransferase NeuD family)